MKLFKKSNHLFLVALMLFILSGCSDDGELCCVPPPNGEFSHTQEPGASAEAFLRADQFTELQVEVDYMPGYQPTAEALDSLETFLQARLNKSQITINTPTEVASGNQDAYSADDIRSLEDQHRDSFTQGDGNTLQAYFLIVDGSYSDQSNVLGIAYYNTSMAFFGQTIEKTSSGITAPPRDKIEGTVFRHEFGHVMGLVNNGTPMGTNHQEEGAHCTEEGCLMEAAVETSNFFANIFDGDIPNLDPLCVEDVQANGGK